jgi:hypothetical protein
VTKDASAGTYEGFTDAATPEWRGNLGTFEEFLRKIHHGAAESAEAKFAPDGFHGPWLFCGCHDHNVPFGEFVFMRCGQGR